MNKSALQDIQQALNSIRSEIERVDDETKWAALELMLSTSASVVALAKEMTKPKTKTIVRTVKEPRKQHPKQPQSPSSPVTIGTSEKPNFEPIRPIPPLSNQQVR